MYTGSFSRQAVRIRRSISVAALAGVSRAWAAVTCAHAAAAATAEMGDDGTNDLLVSDVIRTGELEAWFLAEHLVDTPLVRA